VTSHLSYLPVYLAQATRRDRWVCVHRHP